MRSLLPVRSALILVLFLPAFATHAQDIDTIRTWTVEEFAQKMTDQMTPRVPLNAEQAVQVQRINLKFAGQVMPVLTGTGDTNSKVGMVKDLDRQRAEELAIFLSPEQMRQVRQIQAENRKKMKRRYYERH